MKFYRIQHNTIMSGLVVRWKAIGFAKFEISASRDGVMIHGVSPNMDNSDTEDTISVLRRAYEIRHTYTSHDGRLHFEETDLTKEPDCVVEIRKSHFGSEDKIVATKKIETKTSE